MAHRMSLPPSCYERWKKRGCRILGLFRGYLWILYLSFLALLIYYFQVPIKAYEKVDSVMDITSFINSLSPKFYVALTGTSSLVSGFILIFEWWYFKVNAIEANVDSDTGSDLDENFEGSKSLTDLQDLDDFAFSADCKACRNPMSLFRGAEYRRFSDATGREALTFHDLNLSSQDHQTFFCCESDGEKEDYDIMSMAWRERESHLRIATAKRALSINSDCAPALILLAEEECETLVQSEELFRKALKIVEAMYRRNQVVGYADQESQKARDINTLVFIRRRLAMCLRRQGRIREAIKIMRDLIKEFPTLNVMNIHENLIEALLEQQAYADAMAVLAKYDSYDDNIVPKSATICFTSALLKARGVADKFEPETMKRRGFSSAELSAVEAIHRAVEFNPHVPLYLLEMRPVMLPPEHVLRRGDSEAISYAFWHLQHWKRVDGALRLLQYTWEGTFRLLPNPTEKGHLFYPYPSCTEQAEKDLLPSHHEISVYPKKEFPLWTLFASMFSCSVAMFAVLLHQYPEDTAIFISSLSRVFSLCYEKLVKYAYSMIPENIISLLASKPSGIPAPASTHL